MSHYRLQLVAYATRVPALWNYSHVAKIKMGAFKKQGGNSNLASNREMESEKEQETERYWMKKSEKLLLKKDWWFWMYLGSGQKPRFFFFHLNRVSHRCCSVLAPPTKAYSGWPNYCVASGLFFSELWMTMWSHAHSLTKNKITLKEYILTLLRSIYGLTISRVKSTLLWRKKWVCIVCCTVVML